MDEFALAKSIEEMANELGNEVINLRRDFHQYPELSFEEYRTSKLISGILREIPGLTVSNPTTTSVLAVLKGDKEGKVLAIRSDIDALALQEENEIDYKSKHDGVMHACGHDGHAAMLIGAIKILAKFQSEIKGEIHFIFQHAEERHPGGARELVAQGVLKGVDMIITAHLWVALAVGKVGLAAGPLMAAPDNFDISIIGRGGHAAMPQEVIDPIAISAQVISSLQNIVSRKNNPFDPLVLSVTGIHGGSTYNIIPDRVNIKGTVRTFTPEMRDLIPTMMETTIKGICSAFGAKYLFNYELGYDPVINDEAVVAKISKALERGIGTSYIEKMNPVMGGEDFSAYLKQVPGALIFIGAGNIQQGILNPHHHSCFNIDETSLGVGMKVLVFSALGLLE